MSTSRITVALLAAALVLNAGLFWARAAADGPEEVSRVRILLVIDTDGFAADTNGFAFDRDSVKKILKETLREQNLEDRYTLDILHGPDATPARVRDYYRNLKVQPSEALLFYYSGHGGTDQGRGHFLDLKAGRLFRSELRTAMEAKRPRLLVLLSDCCAGYVSSPLDATVGRIELANPEKDKADAKSKKKRVDLAARQNTLKSVRGETVRHLLFHHRGVVDITACDVGKLALSRRKRGGYFTLTLTGLLAADGDRFDANPDGLIGWDGFFHVLQTATGRYANRDAYAQTPRAFSLSAVGSR